MSPNQYVVWGWEAEAKLRGANSRLRLFLLGREAAGQSSRLCRFLGVAGHAVTSEIL